MSIERQDRSDPLIEQLSDTDSSVRQHAAEGLFARGGLQVKSCTREWLVDSEIRACFLLDAPDFPRVTVGIAVQTDTFSRIRSANGMPQLADVPPDIDAMEFELEFTGGIRLDILTARDSEGNGAIARFLEKRSEGIQQVELDVRSLDRATELLQTRFGLTPIYPAARPGADSSRVNFFLVPLSDGAKLLIELVEWSSQERSGL